MPDSASVPAQSYSFNEQHVGRSFGDGRWLEDECPCPKQPCGLVKYGELDPDCPHHGPTKTIRQQHSDAECPGVHP